MSFVIRRVFSRLPALVCASVALTSLCGIAGCDKETGWRTHKFEEKTIKPKAHDVQIPEVLWQKIEALTSGGAGGAAAEGGGDGSGSAAKPAAGGHEAPAAKSEHGAPAASAGESPSSSVQRPPTNFETIKVYLIERNKGVLKTGDIALSFPNGGGELDLSDFVEPLRGSFYVVFEYLPAVEKPDTKVFVLSQAVSRKIGKEQVGAGCDVFMDVSKAVADAAKGEGFLVNTSDQRHISALAGTYVFASTHDGKLHLSSLIIRDSNHRALQCRR